MTIARHARRAFFALAPLALAATPAGAQTLPTVTVPSEGETGYSPAAGTTATKTTAPLRDIPQSVNVVPQQLIRDQGARSMEDALRNVPGVAFSHGDGQRDQVTIRGFTAISDQFIDGVRDDALYFRDLSNIERVEVLKGPAAVLYGRGSSGGLINRITRKPRFGATFGEAALTLGSDDLKRVEADLNTGLGERAAFRLDLAREDSGSYRNQQFVDRYNFAPSLALDLGGGSALLLQYTKARDQRLTDFGIPSLDGRPVDVPISTYYGSPDARRDDTTTTMVDAFTATFDHRFDDRLSLRNVTRLSRYALDRYNTLPSGTTNPADLTVGRSRSFILRDEDSVFNQTDVTFKGTPGGMRHEWLAGAEVGRQRKRAESVSGGVVDRVPVFDPEGIPVPPIPPGAFTATSAIPSHTTQDVLGLYVQDQVTLAPGWKMLAGLRYDAFRQSTRFDHTLPALQRTDRSWSPRIGLVWQPTDTQSYYVSYSRSFQPSAEAFALTASNADNAPEITRNIEAGTKLDLLDGNLNVTVAVFNLERSNIKNTDPTDPTRLINVGRQRTNGLELAASGRLPGRWDVSAGYAFLDAEMVESVAFTNTVQEPVVAIPAQGKVPSLTPRHSAFLWAMKHVGEFAGGQLRLGGGLNYMAERYTSLTNQVILPSYVTADLAGSYDTGRYEVAVNLKNLADRVYYISAHGSNDNLILPGPPRQLQVTLRARF